MALIIIGGVGAVIFFARDEMPYLASWIPYISLIAVICFIAAYLSSLKKLKKERLSGGNKKNKNKIKRDWKGIKEEINGLVVGVIVLIVGIAIYQAVSSGFNKFGSGRDDKNAAKSSCSRQASEANSEFAAKGIYKSCMKRRGY